MFSLNLMQKIKSLITSATLNENNGNEKTDEWAFLKPQQELFKGYMIQHPIRRQLAIQRARNYVKHAQSRI